MLTTPENTIFPDNLVKALNKIPSCLNTDVLDPSKLNCVPESDLVHALTYQNCINHKDFSYALPFLIAQLSKDLAGVETSKGNQSSLLHSDLILRRIGMGFYKESDSTQLLLDTSSTIFYLANHYSLLIRSIQVSRKNEIRCLESLKKKDIFGEHISLGTRKAVRQARRNLSDQLEQLPKLEKAILSLINCYKIVVDKNPQGKTANEADRFLPPSLKELNDRLNLGFKELSQDNEPPIIPPAPTLLAKLTAVLHFHQRRKELARFATAFEDTLKELNRSEQIRFDNAEAALKTKLNNIPEHRPNAGSKKAPHPLVDLLIFEDNLRRGVPMSRTQVDEYKNIACAYNSFFDAILKAVDEGQGESSAHMKLTKVCTPWQEWMKEINGRSATLLSSGQPAFLRQTDQLS